MGLKNIVRRKCAVDGTEATWWCGSNRTHYCSLHKHPIIIVGKSRTGDCCIMLNERSSGKKRLTSCSNLDRGKKCLSPGTYRCSRRGRIYCWTHAHTFEATCCSYDRLLDRYVIDSRDEVLWKKEDSKSEEDDDAIIFSCEKRACTNKDAENYCERKQKWYCDTCKHDKECCTKYDDSGETVSGETEVLKEVKFAAFD